MTEHLVGGARLGLDFSSILSLALPDRMFGFSSLFPRVDSEQLLLLLGSSETGGYRYLHNA